MHVKQEAKLRNWRFIKEDGLIKVRGVVFGHPKLKDGHEVVTTQIIKYNPNCDVVETLHTFYKLED